MKRGGGLMVKIGSHVAPNSSVRIPIMIDIFGWHLTHSGVKIYLAFAPRDLRAFKGS